MLAHLLEVVVLLAKHAIGLDGRCFKSLEVLGMLLDLVDGVVTSPTSEIVSVELLIRESCGAGIRSAGSGAKGR